MPRKDFAGTFSEIIRRSKGSCRVKLAQLLRLRAEFQKSAALTRPEDDLPSAAAINARNQQFLDEVGRILGAERFESLFGFRLGQEANLVDPEIRRQQQLLQQ